MMHAREKSDSAVVAEKPSNKAGQPGAEAVERRAEAEGNAYQQSTRRAQNRESVSQALERIRQVARQRKKEKFTALFHHISIEHLREAYFELKKDAAPGVDGLTWRAYEADLERRLAGLHARLERGAYRALPSRRVYISKLDGRQRPLAVAALEDKIVQRAAIALLNAIYEREFLGFSYGFRPGRNQHDALDALIVGITSRKVNYIFDGDLRSFFDSVSQEWLVRFLKHRIADSRMIRLIQKWLKAGILEDGIVTVSDRGTGQGSVILGRALATARSRGRYDHREVCRRPGRGLRARGRRPAFLGRDARTLAEVLAVAASEFGRRAATNRKLRVPGLHLHLRKIAARALPAEAQEPGRPHAGEAQGDQGGTATADAPADSRAGEVVEASRHRFLRISRGADQRSRTLRVPLPHHGPVATHAPAAQSTRPHHVGTDHAAGRRLSPQTPRSSPLAKCALCRQAPEVGAECPNRARSDLCGGHSVMSVPTAIRRVP